MAISILAAPLHDVNDALENLQEHAGKVELSTNAQQLLQRFSSELSKVNAQAVPVDDALYFDIPATQSMLRDGDLTVLANDVCAAIQPLYEEAERASQIRMSTMSGFARLPLGMPEMSHAAYGRALGAAQALKDKCETLHDAVQIHPDQQVSSVRLIEERLAQNSGKQK